MQKVSKLAMWLVVLWFLIFMPLQGFCDHYWTTNPETEKKDCCKTWQFDAENKFQCLVWWSYPTGSYGDVMTNFWQVNVYSNGTFMGTGCWQW